MNESIRHSEHETSAPIPAALPTWSAFKTKLARCCDVSSRSFGR